MKNIKKNLILLIILIILGGFGIVVYASFNEQINFQGKLTDSSDQAVSNGTKCMQFLLYTTATGDSSIWSEGWTATSDATLSTTSGLFSALLGSNASLSSINFNQTSLYLEVQYDASCDATYEEVFSPRKRLGAVPAAFESKQLAGYTWATPDAIGSGTANTGAFTTLSASGLATFSYTPQGTGVGQGSLYINPSTATADYTLLGLAVGGAEKFRIDAEGDIIKVGNITMADLGWIGLGSSAGLIGFDDSTTDYIYFSNANVGIGTTGPDARLDVLATSGAQLYLTYTDGSVYSSFTTNSGGDLTINATGGDISLDDENLSTTGIISSATWQGAAIGAGYGGTGLSSYATGDLLYASGTTALSKLSIATADYVLTSSGTLPQWSNSLSIAGLTVSGLTSGRVLYATTGGQLTDSTNLTFNGTTLTAGGLSTAGTLAGGTTNVSGLATFSYTPQGTGVSQGSLYINPATATADYTLLGLAVGGAERFRIDEDGDVVAGTWKGTTIGVDYGGTGAATLTGILKGNGTSAFTGLTATSDYVTYWSDANTLTGEQYLSVSRGGTGAGTLNNLITLTTHTTGNYVATIADAGNSTISVSGSGAEGAEVTLDAVDLNCTDCLGATEISDIYAFNTGDEMTGLLTLSAVPSGTGVSQGSLYINPATATADYTLLGLAVGGAERFRVDAEGQTYITSTSTPQLKLSYDATNDATFSVSSSGDLTIAAYGGDISFGDENLSTTGTISSATWQGAAIGAGYGGTGLSSYATGDLLYASGTTALSKLSIATADYVLTSSGTLPQWSSNIALGALPTGGNWDISSDLTIETPNLFIGATGGSYPGLVSIGTATPGAKLHLGETRTSGTIFKLDYPGSTTLAGDLYGLDMDLSANLTQGSNSILGFRMTLPSTGTADRTFSQFLEGSTTLYNFKTTQAVIDVPVSFGSAGDVAISYDLQFTNDTASYIKSYGPLYIEAGDPNFNRDLTLRAAGTGAVIVNDTFLVQNASSDSTTAYQFANAAGTAILDIDTTNSRIGIGTTGPDRLFHAEISGTATSDVTYAQRLSHITSGTAAAGFGTGIEFELENASGTNRVASTIQGVWEDATDASEDASLRFLTIQNGTLTEAMRIDDTGNVGIGTTGPDRKLDVLDASNPQLRLTNTDGSVYTEFSVAATTGDLTVSLYPNTSANDIIFNMPGGTTGLNLSVCQGDACPTTSGWTLADGGNLILENAVYWPASVATGDAPFKIAPTGTDRELGVYDASGDAVLIFDEATP